MPVILDPVSYDSWLDHAVADAGQLMPLLVPRRAAGMVSWPVGPKVNHVANDGAECREPAPKQQLLL